MNRMQTASGMPDEETSSYEEGEVKTSKVMRVGRFYNEPSTGTVIMFENGDYFVENDFKGNKSFSCALKEGDIVKYKKNGKKIRLVRIVSFSEARY